MQGHPFHKSSFRPQLVMGAERKPMLVLILTCVTIAVPGLNLVAFAVAGLLWACGQFLLVLMARADPQMLAVFSRNRSYPGFIPPFSTPFQKPRGRWW